MFSTSKEKTSEVIYEGSSTVVEADETVLDALLRAGHTIPNGCRAGVCQSCIMVADQEPPTHGQTGLNLTQKSMNQFLACLCKPQGVLKVKNVADEKNKEDAIVISKNWLNEQVIRLRLKVDLEAESNEPFNYHPGQYLTLWKDTTIARSYSLASHPDLDDYLEFHIKVIKSGQFSNWVADDLAVGDTLKVQGPMGQCIYTADPQQPLFLCAIGTGLAPIYGILRDAIHLGHRGPINVVIGSSGPQGFYYIDELQKLAAENPLIRICFVSQQGDCSFAHTADLYNFCRTSFPDLKRNRVFLCGAESFVKKMKKQSFLAGASMGDISADVFLAFTPK